VLLLLTRTLLSLASTVNQFVNEIKRNFNEKKNIIRVKKRNKLKRVNKNVKQAGEVEKIRIIGNSAG
jgi:hypothetical protein